MSIEPTCDYCNYTDKFRCRNLGEARVCERYIVKKELEMSSGTKEYKPWKDLTDEEKGTLLLAHHEGKRIQTRTKMCKWHDVETVAWSNDQYYRIKPEPVVETRDLYIYTKDTDYHTTKVGTIQLIDGKPDVNSIEMEEL